jgi:hypothetical protein
MPQIFTFDSDVYQIYEITPTAVRDDEMIVLSLCYLNRLYNFYELLEFIILLFRKKCR